MCISLEVNVCLLVMEEIVAAANFRVRKSKETPFNFRSYLGAPSFQDMESGQARFVVKVVARQACNLAPFISKALLT